MARRHLHEAWTGKTSNAPWIAYLLRNFRHNLVPGVLSLHPLRRKEDPWNEVVPGEVDIKTSLYHPKYSLVCPFCSITEEMKTIQGLRLQIANELERLKQLLDERRLMLQEGIAHGAVGFNISQKVISFQKFASLIENLEKLRLRAPQESPACSCSLFRLNGHIWGFNPDCKVIQFFLI